MDDAQGKDQAAEAQVEAAKAGLAAAQEHLHAATANRERVQALFDYTKITTGRMSSQKLSQTISAGLERYS